MKQLNILLLSVLLLGTPGIHADTVVEEVPDTLPGKGFGGLIGVMVGTVVAGPVGAIGVGLVSAWLGGKAQEVTGLYGRAYHVERQAGCCKTVRSPRQRWAIGDQVRIDGNRLVQLDM